MEKASVPDGDVEITIYNANSEVEHQGSTIVDGAGEFEYRYNIIGSTSYTVEARSIVEGDGASTEFLIVQSMVGLMGPRWMVFCQVTGMVL
ncbi:MAG: hypothetical protein U5N58_06640 [Actinomycetota bacterium]|nr:hypothetical protein [Actinomycetota bacterium]